MDIFGTTATTASRTYAGMVLCARLMTGLRPLKEVARGIALFNAIDSPYLTSAMYVKCQNLLQAGQSLSWVHYGKDLSSKLVST